MNDSEILLLGLGLDFDDRFLFTHWLGAVHRRKHEAEEYLKDKQGAKRTKVTPSSGGKTRKVRLIHTDPGPSLKFMLIDILQHAHVPLVGCPGNSHRRSCETHDSRKHIAKVSVLLLR